MQRATLSKAKKGRPSPDKLFYKIGEVSNVTGIEPYVLRYWETEFPFLKPRKNKSGQRVYVKKDLEVILKIKDLLYNERYTIEGVRKRLGESHTARNKPHTEEKQAPAISAKAVSSAEAIEMVKSRLREILRKL